MTLYMEGSGWKIKIDERSQSGGEEKDKTRRVYRLVLSLTCLRGGDREWLFIYPSNTIQYKCEQIMENS